MNTDRKAGMTRRLPSVDFLRGIAIFAMIQTHLWQAFIDGTGDTAAAVHRYFVQPLGGHAAPLFVLVSGLSAHLATRTLRAKSSDTALTSAFIKRGLALFALSTGINLVAGPILHVLDISLLNWGVVQLVGFCLCLVPLFVRLGWPGRLLWTATPLLLSEWIYPSAKILPQLFTGFAPLFPWATLFFAGMLIGECYTRSLEASALHCLSALAAIGLFLAVPFRLVMNSIYSPVTWAHTARLNLPSALVFIGNFILLLVIFGYLLDYRRFEAKPVDAFIGFGQHALSVYYLQLVGLVMAPMLLQAVLGFAPTVSWIWFFPLLLLVLFVLHVIINVIWPRFNYFLSLEWGLAMLVKGEYHPPIPKGSATGEA